MATTAEIHWTYMPSEVRGDLQQGDILLANSRLREVFREVHPYFLNKKYVGFVVTTQSCDLVRRSGQKCRTRYINVAVVRTLQEVLPSLLQAVCQPLVLGTAIYDESDRYKAKQLLERIFNQNETALGLYYLHPDPDVGISEELVAMLRVSVAFRSEHYEVFQQARVGSLAPPFRDKLGWLVGNLYSRVGTEDWPRHDLDTMVKQFLADGATASPTGSGPLFTSRSVIAEARRRHVNLTAGGMELGEVLASISLPTAEQNAAEVVARIAAEVFGEDQSPRVEQLRLRIINDERFKALLKRR